MYEPLPPDLTTGFIVFTILLLSFGVGLLVQGIKDKRRDLTLVGAAMLVLLIAGWVVGLGPATQYEDNRRAMMEQTIMDKYNEKYNDPYYLRKVEFSGHGGKGETGKYFTLSYNDLTTEERMFWFSDDGEPRCFCNLYQY